jgi:sugar (pentulose or hexulose) kinase
VSYVGVDIGASFVKAALLDPVAGTVVARSRRSFPELSSARTPGAREGDPATIVAQVWAAVEEAAAGVERLDAILVCGQMHGVVVTAPDGRPLSPFVSWQDQRAAGDLFAEVRARVGEAVVDVGNELRVGSPVTVLHALARAGALPDGAMPMSLPDFVVAARAGHWVATHPTNAAAHGAWDVAGARWHAGLIRELGLDRLRWPDVAGDGAIVAHVEVNGRAVPVLAAVGDQQAALLGVGLGFEELSVNVATGSQVSALAVGAAAGTWQVRPYFDGLFLRTITHLPAGRALNALVRLVTELALERGEESTWAYIEDAVARTPRGRLAVDLAFFESAAGYPGSITGITEEELSVGGVFRAAFERMADTYAQSAGRLGVDLATRRVVLSGGLVQRSPALSDAIVARFPGGARREPELDATLRGLLALARLHAGVDRSAMRAAARIAARPATAQPSA